MHFHYNGIITNLRVLLRMRSVQLPNQSCDRVAHNYAANETQGKKGSEDKKSIVLCTK